MNEQASAWLTAVEGLPAVHKRLKRVAILCRDGVDVIASHDGYGVLQYIDPPYLPETRASKEVYAHEMGEADHVRLLDVAKQLKGMVAISGYPSKLYDDKLASWNRHTFDVPNHAAGGSSKRRMTECLFTNF